MQFTEIAAFEVERQAMAWPWITFAADGGAFAYPAASLLMASKLVGDDGELNDGPAFPLPNDLRIPEHAPDPSALIRDLRDGLHGASLTRAHARLAATGVVAGQSVVAILGPEAERVRAELDTWLGPGFVAQAVAFTRDGLRVWVSAESETESAILLVDADTLALLGAAKGAPFPPPATHELFLHPTDDAVLLLAACGDDGTFGRVVRNESSRLKAVWTSLDGGGIPAGMVGFSADATRVYLAEADELRTHAWPGLKEIASVPFDDDFVSSFAGAVFQDEILVDGQDSETKEDAVSVFDADVTRARFLSPPVPQGMWSGRVGHDCLVTVEAKGNPARGRVFRVRP